MFQANRSSPPKTKRPLLKPGDVNAESKSWKDAGLPIDFLLLTAKQCELLSCIDCLSDVFKSNKDGLGFVYFGKIGNGDEKLKIAVIQCNVGSSTPQGSTIVVPLAVAELRPKAVICVGYCAGLKKTKVKLGDVIISSKLATYASIKITENKTIYRGVQVPASPRLSEILRSAAFGWIAPLENPNELDVEVHPDGLLLSGPEVVSSDKRREELIEDFPDAIGLEMEGEGKISLKYIFRKRMLGH